MLSTLHHDKELSETDLMKPEVIMFYNKTKVGIDVVDEMAKRYTTRCKTLRWPMVHFHNVLDITGINTATIFSFLVPNWRDDQNRSGRRYLLLSLAKSLCTENVQHRLHNTIGLHSKQVQLMKTFLGIEEIPAPLEGLLPQVTKRCDICKTLGKPTNQANKTKQTCHTCNKYICKQHAVQIVSECLNCHGRNQ